MKTNIKISQTARLIFSLNYSGHPKAIQFDIARLIRPHARDRRPAMGTVSIFG
jgi:hypothetical protein